LRQSVSPIVKSSPKKRGNNHHQHLLKYLVLKDFAHKSTSDWSYSGPPAAQEGRWRLKAYHQGLIGEEIPSDPCLVMCHLG
jgi:hypothetical protein